jgi:GT2 family glycosyltransferase
MRISVIIPHFNQPAELLACLASLRRQSYATAVEIIVIDNGSTEPPRLPPDDSDIMLAKQPIPGPGPARNRGVELASGDVLAFIDADCTAHEDWLQSIAQRMADGRNVILGGAVLVKYRDPERPSFVEPYEAVYSYRNDKHIREGFSGTGNLAVRRNVLEQVGPFGGIDVAEDRDWGLRAGRSGFAITYCPEMIVYHPARLSFAELARKWDRHVAHDHAHLRKGRFSQAKWLARSLAVLVSPLAEVPTVIATPKIGGIRERALAFACLTAVRAYRARRMIEAIFRRGEHGSGDWQRRPN